MRALWLLLASGCDVVFSAPFSPPIVPDDAAPDAPGCSASLFGAPVEVGGTFNTGNHVDPTFATPLELWLTFGTELRLAIRTTPDDDFGLSIPSSSDTPDSDFDAAFGADGRALAFIHSSRIYLATRTSTAPQTPFGAALENPGIDTFNGIDLSANGLVLYVADADKELRVATRDNIDAPFGQLGESLASNIEFPSVSPDGLELYYNDSGVIRRRIRTRTDIPFEKTSETVFDNAGDPDISADATSMLLSRSGIIMQASRTCP